MTAKKQAPGIMSRMGDSMKHTASSMMLKTRDKEFTDIAEFSKTFHEKISSVEKVTDKLARERFGMFYVICVFLIFRCCNTKNTRARPSGKNCLTMAGPFRLLVAPPTVVFY